MTLQNPSYWYGAIFQRKDHTESVPVHFPTRVHPFVKSAQSISVAQSVLACRHRTGAMAPKKVPEKKPPEKASEKAFSVFSASWRGGVRSDRVRSGRGAEVKAMKTGSLRKTRGQSSSGSHE